MPFFTFCPECNKKIMINLPGTKLKNFNNKNLTCPHCKIELVIFKGKLFNFFEVIINSSLEDIYPGWITSIEFPNRN